LGGSIRVSDVPAVTPSRSVRENVTTAVLAVALGIATPGVASEYIRDLVGAVVAHTLASLTRTAELVEEKNFTPTGALDPDAAVTRTDPTLTAVSCPEVSSFLELRGGIVY